MALNDFLFYFKLFSCLGAGADKLLKFKKWFWSIVEKMSSGERKDLVSTLFRAGP